MEKKLAPKISPSQRKKWLQLLAPSAEPAGTGSSPGSKREIYRFVADTNILVSAVLFGGRPEAVFQDILTKQQLILSDYIVEEFVRFLKKVRPKLSQKWLRFLRQKLEVYCCDDSLELRVPARDFKDNPILQLAIKQQATIVTNDKDLLEYRTSMPVSVLSVAEYFELFLDA